METLLYDLVNQTKRTRREVLLYGKCNKDLRIKQAVIICLKGECMSYAARKYKTT